MCDFREIQEIRLFEEDLFVTIDEVKRCSHCPECFPEGMLAFSAVQEKGFYLIAASGSCHMYYTGTRWLREDQDYEVTKFTERCPFAGH